MKISLPNIKVGFPVMSCILYFSAWKNVSISFKTFSYWCYCNAKS